MCPDESLLTAYIDNEVPSPWKERIEMHLCQCERCANRVAQYRALKVALKAADVLEASKRQEAAKRIQASLKSITDESSRREISSIFYVHVQANICAASYSSCIASHYGILCGLGFWYFWSP